MNELSRFFDPEPGQAPRPWAGQRPAENAVPELMKLGKSWNSKRRRFLQAAVTASAAAAVVSCGKQASPWRVLTREEGEIAAAVCECLIPTDEFPGAQWAGAVEYIDRQLSGYFRKHLEAYRTGLAAFNEKSRQQLGKPFAEIPQQEQVEILKAAEKAKSRFFALILSHTMESYYGDPRHGGNRDDVGYRSLGIPTTPVRGRSKHDINQNNPGAA
jgi:gluconate 2-dehydrogenase gamma chain